MGCRSSIDPRSDVTDDGSAYLELVANDPQSAALALGSDDWATHQAIVLTGFAMHKLAMSGCRRGRYVIWFQ